MSLHLSTTRRLRVLLLATLACVLGGSLLVPAGASAILLGMEANGELINSNVTHEMRAATLDKMQQQGIQVVRVNVGWNEIATGACAGQSVAQMRNHRNPCYSWGVLDSMVQLAGERKMQIIVSLTRVPQWVSGNADPHWMGNTKPQFNKILNHYVALHQAAGTRFNGKNGHRAIRYWTIHNEPNSVTFWAPRASAARYAELYGKTAVALRKAHPKAKIAVGPINPTGSQKGSRSVRPVPFMRQFQTHVRKYLPGSLTRQRTYIDAWAHNPYPAGRAPKSSAGHPQAIQMGHVKSRLIKQLDASPITRKKPIWATEFGWETSHSSYKVSLARQAQYIAEAFDWLDSTKRVTIGIHYGLTDAENPVDWQSGTIRLNGRIKTSFNMMQRMISVPSANTVKRGTTIRVWGRSSIAPKTGVLTYKITGKRCDKRGKVNQACTIKPLRKGKDNARWGTLKLTTPGTYTFRVYDKGNKALGIEAGYGPSRVIRVR